MSRPRAVAFDWGGVFTVGTFDSSAVRALATLTGLEPEALEPTYLRLMVAFEAGEHDLPAFHELLSAATGTNSIIEDFRAAFLGAVRERAETYELLGSLPPDLRVGVLSNNVAELSDTVRADPRLARVNAFVFSNEVRVRKPDAAAYGKLVSALGERPGDVVFVDDNQANVTAATALGLRGVLFDSAFAARWAAAAPGIALPRAFGSDAFRRSFAPREPSAPTG